MQVILSHCIALVHLREAHNQALPVTTAAGALYLKACQEGLGDDDFSAVLQTVLGEAGSNK